MSKPIKNNSQLLYLQARQLFEQARTKFEDGTIKSEPKLIESVFNSFQAFFTSMGKPNFVPRYAPEEGPPWSKDYNDMMNEIRQDLELLFQEVDIIGRTLYSDFNHNMIQHEIINKQFEEVLDKMRDLETYAGINQTGVQFGRDDFLNKDKIDYSRISGTPLELIDGAVTLPQVSRKNVAQNAKVAIVVGNREKNKFILGTESNGFPGNNTEIHSVTDDVLTNRNYIPTFLGEENNHSDYSSVLDGTPNTWFEYEKVNVREHDKIRVAKNLGWDYQVHENQTIAWAEDPTDGTLKLHMQITLDEETVINQINCNMYTPPSYNAKTAVVKNILVSDGKEVPRSILPKNHMPDQYSFHFPPVKARVISVLFEQKHKYITDIGHIFFEKKMQAEDNSEYAMDMATKKYKYAPRVEGPLIALEDLGINVNVSSSNVDVKYPMLDGNNQNTRSIGETINRLMNSVDSETVDMGVEKFEGFRWCIGIRDIEIYSCEYAAEGELVTHPYYFEKPLDKISLEVNENIPSAFASNDTFKYDWLKYFVSVDDGATWYPITPLVHETLSEEQPPKIYTVRTIETSEQRLDYKSSYIESEYPVYSLRMKIVARRPEEDTAAGFMIQNETGALNTSFVQSSPIVNSYKFSLSTINEIIDSDESDTTLSIREPSKPNPGPGESNEPPIEETPVESDLTVLIANKKTDWCKDEELIIKGNISSSNLLVRAELYINGEQRGNIGLTDKYDTFSFTISADSYSESIITAVVKGYDTYGNAMDSDVINIIDCASLPPEDRPNERNTEVLNVVIDEKVNKLCECDPLIFYGSAQGPNPIQTVMFYVNGIAIDPNNLGAPPENDPCGVNMQNVQPAQVSVKQMAENDLLEIEDFGEWLDAFEEQNDCGCKNKKRREVTAAATFQIQETPFTAMASEHPFQVEIPFWKLREVGVTIGSTMKVEVIVYDSTNAEAKDEFLTLVEDCDKPSVDENGNPRVRDCYLLESIEVHYFNQTIQSIDSKVIPANSLPYEHIDNGAGVGITVGWRKDYKGPILMLTKGYDQSDYSFQVHAVGLHYLNEYDQPKTTWTTSIVEKTEGVKNESKMIGEPIRPNEWMGDITNNGNYSTAPGLEGMNDYVTFSMNNEWITKACDVNMSFEPTQYLRPEVPVEDSSREVLYDCNLLTHIFFQVYDTIEQKLKDYKIHVSATSKDTYVLQTKNGNATIIVGWVDYLKAPSIKILSGTGTDNILLTSVGVLYLDIYGEAQTSWANQVRYKTSGVHYPEFVIGMKKQIGEISWIANGVVNYAEATYIGRQEDMVAYRVGEEFTDNMCPPVKIIDSAIGIDPNNPPDVPSISFTNTVATVCYEDEVDTIINAVATDLVGLKEVTFGIRLNGVDIYGPFTDSINTTEHTVSFQISPMTLQTGDTVNLHIKATNQFGVSNESNWDVLVESCAPIAVASGDITLDTVVTYSYGTDIDLGNFLAEWTQWHIQEAGNWTTVVNAGRTELTNTINQNGHSGWYNANHMNEADYYFEMKYQARGGDDDMMGAAFHIQRDAGGVVTGFYSVEHDGNGSWVNGGGFRILKHVVSGAATTKTVLAEDATLGWTLDAHRAYRIAVTIEGDKITAELYGEETLTRPVGEAAVEPYNWQLLKTLVTNDSSYPSGSWGPITNSTPESFFWDLKMNNIQQITSTDEAVLLKNISVGIFERYEVGQEGTYKDIQLNDLTIGEHFETAIAEAIQNRGILAESIVKVEYSITQSNMTDQKNNPILLDKVKFIPSNSSSPQSTNDPAATIWANLLIDKA